jgi:hypothetical protein
VTIARHQSLYRTRLAPARARVRTAMLGVQFVATGAVATLISTTEHSTEWAPVHRLTGEENGLVAITMMAIIAALTLAALRLGFWSGILATASAFVGSIVAFFAIAFVHLLSEVTHDRAGRHALSGCMVIAVLAIAGFVVEIVVRTRQRDEDLARDQPALPTAVLVR